MRVLIDSNVLISAALFPNSVPCRAYPTMFAPQNGGTICEMDKTREIQVDIVRSGRKSLAVEIRPDGGVLVRAPYGLSQARIRAFLDAKRKWIETRRAAVLARRQAADSLEKLTAAELDALAAAARTDLTERTARFAPMVGVTYGRVTIRRQRTRWGSCSAKGNLNFNCLLMLAPPEVRDYVAVHELCHRKHMDHSRRFWAEVERVLPDWRERRRWLRDNGELLMARLDRDGTGV